MRRAIAAAGGVALIASLFAPWFSGGGWIAFGEQMGSPPSFSGWELFVTIDVLLVACALAAIVGSAPLAAAAGPIALLTVATRAIGGGMQAGFYVALAASLLMLARAELPRRPTRADALAVAAGALVFGSLFLPWYGLGEAPAVNRLFTEQISAWEAFELTPVAIAVATALALILRRPAAAAAAIALVIYGLLSMPDPLYGAWLCLAAAVVLLVGTLRAGPDPVVARA